MAWNYTQPVDIHFGWGRITELATLVEKLGGKRCLLIASKCFFRNGLVDKLVASSPEKFVATYGEISPNPDVKEVDACADIIRQEHIDSVVVIGGGSPMDAAKAAASIALTDESIRSYHGTGKALPSKHLPLIAVPTTSGTGSEVTCVSVLSDHELGKKAPIVSPNFYPEIALIDPELTVSLPPSITASTGIDVLAHAIEGYWSKHHQPICDTLAIRAAKLVFDYLPIAYKDGTQQEARIKLAEASVMAGLAFTLPKTTASHACSFPLTNIYGIPHGEACGLTLDIFTRINATGKEGYRIETLAQSLGFKNSEALADAIYELKKLVGLRTNLKDLHLTKEQIEELAKLSLHPNILNNPVDITEEQLLEMYTKMS